ERALERRQDLAGLEPVGQDRLREVRVEAVRLAVLVEVGQLAARPVRTLVRSLVALLAGDRVELGRILLELLVGRLGSQLGLCTGRIRGGHARGALRGALRGVED